MLPGLCSATGLNRQEAFSRVGNVSYFFKKPTQQKIEGREKERATKTETDRQTDSQTDGQTDSQGQRPRRHVIKQKK